MAVIRWLLCVILLVKMARTRHSTKPLETDDDTMNANLARARDAISKIQSKLNSKYRSVYRDHLKINQRQRTIRSIGNASVSSNKTGDLFPINVTIPKDVVITFKPFTSRIITRKASPPPTTPHPTADVNFTILVVIQPPPVLQVNCRVEPYSCSDRCTNETYFLRYSIFGDNHAGKQCNCDSSCNDVFTDCCSDFAKKCSKHHVVNDKTNDVQLRKSSWSCDTQLNISMKGCPIKAGLWMITRCPRHSPDDDTKRKCHSAPSKLAADSFDSFVPVVGSSDRLTYRNQHCAKCNNVTKFEFMTLIFKKEAVPPPYFTQAELRKFVDKNQHNLEGIQPNEGQKLRWCFYPDMIDSCPVFHDARDACTNGTVGLVEMNGKVLRNKDCALCNGVSTCGLGPPSVSPCSVGPKSIDRAISLRDYGVSLETNSCPRNQVYDPYLSACRENYEVTELKKSRAADKYQVILSLLKLQNSRSFDDWRSLQKPISGYFKMNDSQVAIEDVVWGFTEIVIICTLDLTPAESLVVASDPELSGNSNDTIGLRRLFKFQEAFELTFPDYGSYTIYRLSVRQTFCVHQHVYKMEEYAILDGLRILINSTGAVYDQSQYYLNRKNNTVSVCSKLLPFQCNGSYIKLNTSEYHLFDNLTLYYNSLVYKFGDYFYEDEKVLICVQFQRNFTISHTRTPKDDLALIVLTWLGFVLSILGLLALLFTYTAFQELRTLPGKNLMSLSISLCLAEILWLCGSTVTANETACTVIAIANHYFFLAFFAASSVIAFDSCLIFGRKFSLRGNTSDGNQTAFYGYFLVTWCFPAIFVLIFALLDHYGVFVTDYGKSDICWLATRDSKLFLFIVPFGVSLLFNLLLFSFIAIRLYKNHKLSAKSLGRNVVKKRKTQNVLVCVKLSTLMGFSWLFGLLQIAVETESDVFAYFFVIFVSFQGLFICVSFLFKRNYYNLYASLISKNFNTSSSKTGASVPQGQNISTPKGIHRDTKL